MLAERGRRRAHRPRARASAPPVTSGRARSSIGPSPRWPTRPAPPRCSPTASRPRWCIELEAAGLVGQDAADASRAILIAVSGALVFALRDLSAYPAEYRPDALWADSDAAIAPETRAALRADPDLDALLGRHAREPSSTTSCRRDRTDPQRGSAMSDTPMNRPGEVAGWPKLVVTYTTDPANIAPLLPPGIEPLEPTVTVGFYCVPVLGEPEHGVSVKVPASWQGVEGHYSLGPRHRPGGGRPHQRRDQRAAQVPLRHHLLPPRRHRHGSGHPPGLHVRRVLGPRRSASPSPGRASFTEHEWWTKYSRAIGGEAGRYDFPPHVVDVATTFEQRHLEDVNGDLSSCATARGTRSLATSRSSKPAPRSW